MSVSRKEVTVYGCERCGHEWIPREPFAEPSAEDLPKVCPKCKSPYWNTPRTFPKPAAKKKVRAKRAK